ncbi:hypothetical protein J2W17_006243 [Pseudomonas lini]|uniref:hypothetical protein n=1 Tax=Pseudomonas lini TaxID=163011 RepID=UPI00277F2A29|nr:hypothetical protein [Pseudomonas lini]MDQ0127243.1 hypothetical protein [Pseudomonas lini]
MANSKKELLEWLALKPRTAGWGAVVAYDRSKCNNLLLQDYINKFTTHSYLEPINEPVAVGDANWQHLSDWVTDVPRLSFENSSKAAGGEASMKMAVIGGTQVAIDNIQGHKRAIAVHSIDALDHPELIAENVLLSKTSGTVGNAGDVVLDLGAPETAKGTWELTFANTRHERRIGGEFFKQYFKGADKEKRLYHLGKIAYTNQQYLKPASFSLRTTTAKGAELSTADNFGDGSVELFIAMRGDQEGGMPPSDDWMGLNVGEEDCTILISNKILMKNCILPGARLYAADGYLQLQEIIERGFISYSTTRDGGRLELQYDLIHVGDKILDPYYDWTELGYGNYKVSLLAVSQGAPKLRVAWADRKDMPIPVAVKNSNSELLGYSSIGLNRVVNADYGFEVDPSSGGVKFILDKSTVTADFPYDTLSKWLNADERRRALESLRAQIIRKYTDILEKIPDLVPSIDVFVLNSILFNSHTHITMKTSSIPGDLVVFGQFSHPFMITSLEHLMGCGAKHTFTVSKDFTGKVKWSVAAIPGSIGEIGTIDEDSGEYSSPALVDIPGTFTRVMVMATDTASNYSSTALVTVVVRDLTVNPVVQICSASTEDASVNRMLSAHSLGEGILQWEVKRGTGTIPTRDGGDGKNTYTAGLKDPSVEGSFLIDEIEVMNLATRKTQTSYVVVTHYQADLTITIDMDNSSFPEGKAKLVARDGRDRPVAAVWDVAEGNGCIDSDGLYTGDPDGQQRFALITARLGGGADTKDGWIILPWPLFELFNKPDPIANLSFD